MAQFPWLFCSPLAGSPLSPPCIPFYLLGTLLAVTGIVHLGLRLLVNWPHLPHPSPNCPPPSKFPEPQLPSALLRRPREYSGSCYPEQKQRSALLAEEGNVNKLLVCIEKKNKGLPFLLRKAVIQYWHDFLVEARNKWCSLYWRNKNATATLVEKWINALLVLLRKEIRTCPLLQRKRKTPMHIFIWGNKYGPALLLYEKNKDLLFF